MLADSPERLSPESSDAAPGILAVRPEGRPAGAPGIQEDSRRSSPAERLMTTITEAFEKVVEEKSRAMSASKLVRQWLLHCFATGVANEQTV